MEYICPHESHAPAVSVDVLAPPLTVRDIVRSTAMKAGNSINRERVATSVATVASGISGVRAS